jgi:DNA-binding MarR family transcriptional regulator
MNAVAFGTKRAFHGFLRVTRKPLASVGLTPARFDMLYVLFASARHHSKPYPTLTQRHLRRTLGICASVTSRMVRALEALGLVTRQRCDLDRRQVRVRLTDRGWDCIRTTQRWLLRGVQRIVLEVICFGAHRDPNQRLWNMDTVEGYLRALRNDFGDKATLYYPWGHPDD